MSPKKFLGMLTHQIAQSLAIERTAKNSALIFAEVHHFPAFSPTCGVSGRTAPELRQPSSAPGTLLVQRLQSKWRHQVFETTVRGSCVPDLGDSLSVIETLDEWSVSTCCSRCNPSSHSVAARVFRAAGIARPPSRPWAVEIQCVWFSTRREAEHV
jgi:hypothetical protein